MNIHHYETSEASTHAAADWFAAQLAREVNSKVMVAGGNTPLSLYAEITKRQLPLAHLQIFALDEYVGVPPEDDRTCANLIRRTVVEAWGIPPNQFHRLNSLEAEAEASIETYERKIQERGGLDLLILGLGRNGHVGFNEPGSASDSRGRVLDLDPVSVDSNRTWFGGDYAPAKGVTVGISTILSARQILLLAFGPGKSNAVKQMIEATPAASCPASWLQGHPHVHVFLDSPAASGLSSKGSSQPPPSRVSSTS